MHEVVKWVLVALFALGAIATIMQIGKEREPISPGVAALIVTLDGILMALCMIFL